MYISLLITKLLWYLAVATHKYVISFCVGLELYNAETPKILYAAYMVVYALMSMIGIATGILVTISFEVDTYAYMVTVAVLQVDRYDKGLIYVKFIYLQCWSQCYNTISMYLISRPLLEEPYYMSACLKFWKGKKLK